MQKQKGKSEKRESRVIKNTKSAKSAKSVKSAKNTKSANSARGVQSSDYNVDNIIAPATVPGSGAVGIIRVSGGDSIKIAAKVIKLKSGAKSASTGAKKGSTTLLSAEPRRLYLANIEENDKLIDELLVAVFKAPDSYTGEDCVEIFTHASAYIMNKVQMMMMREASQLLESKKISAPLRMAFAGEFTQRAFLNGKMDLAQAEAVADLIASETESAHTLAISQMRGSFSAELKSLREELLAFCSLIELELDFSEEDVEFANRSKLSNILTATYLKIKELTESFALGNVIKNGVPVAIVGAVNTGKSTLLNLMLGEERAIVSPIQGTTRDTIEDYLNIDGTKFRFIDTAGIRNTTETIEMMGIERTWQKLKESAIVILMLDATKKDFAKSVQNLVSKIDSKRQKVILLANKADKLAPRRSGKEAAKRAVAESGLGAGATLTTAEYRTDKEAVKEIERQLKKITQELKLKGVKVLCTSLKTEAEQAKKILLGQLSQFGKEFTGNLQNKIYVTNLRHYQALSSAKASIERVFAALDGDLPTDLVAQELRQATYDLGTIIGQITSQEVLNNIFSNFCIGK